MLKEKELKMRELEEQIIDVVKENQPMHIGDIFKILRIGHSKGLNYVISMINQGKLSYASNNQVHI